MQHGIHIDPYICSYFYGRTASSASDDLRACPVATRTALFGEVTQRQLTEISAYAPQALAVTGSAAFDPLAAAVEQLDRDTCRADLGLPAEGRVVTIMANRFWGPQYWRWFVTTLFDALAQLPQWRTVIKLHPHDAPDGYLQAAARVGLEKPLIMRDRLWPAIVAADAVVACYTTTILDAMALSRPVVFPRIPGMEDSLGFAESGGVIAVDDVDQLVAALQRLDEDPAHLAAQVEGAFPVLEEHLHRVDGRASERLALLADELSGTSRPSAPPVVAPSEVGEHV